MNITSEKVKIYAKEFNGKMFYRARLSKKDKNGQYENGYIDVKLPKDTTIEDKTEINITKGFLSFYKSKENKDVFYIVVQEFSKENATQEKTSYTAEELDEGMELPF